MPLTATKRAGVVALSAVLLAVGLAPWGVSRKAASLTLHPHAAGSSSPVGKCPLGYGADASAVPLHDAAHHHHRHTWSTMATSPADRAKAALLGAFVADAASTCVAAGWQEAVARRASCPRTLPLPRSPAW